MSGRDGHSCLQSEAILPPPASAVNRFERTPGIFPAVARLEVSRSQLSKAGETAGTAELDGAVLSIQALTVYHQPRPANRQALASLIFLSRWLQAPLYVGLIVAQAVYVIRFVVELWHLISFALLGHGPPASVPKTVIDPETVVMLTVLGLIDVVMIANLLIMVIIGGYETFVSRLKLQGHPDQPEWLSHVNAGILKVKLATALIGISSIHLLKTFINAHTAPENMMMWQVIIHLAFLISALSLAWIDRLTVPGAARSEA